MVQIKAQAKKPSHLIKIIRTRLKKTCFKVGPIEYTSGNYDEKGKLIQRKIPTLISEIGEIGVFNNNFYLVLIIKRSFVTLDFIKNIGQICPFTLYGLNNFLVNLDPRKLSNIQDEQYLQIQFDNIENIERIVQLHIQLKNLFQNYPKLLINQLEIDILKLKII